MADSKAIFDDVDDESPVTENDRLLTTQPACLKCGKLQRMMKCCTRCHSAFYCSQVCFAKHWPVHKKSCQPKNDVRRNRTQQDTEVAGGEKTVYKVVHHQKPEVPLHINFQKAADALSAKSTTEQKSDVTNQKDDERDLPGQEVILRYNKEKHKFKVCDAWDAQMIFSRMANFLCCIKENMRVIHKGKVVTEDTVRSVVAPKAVFQVLGEKMEDSEGLLPKDIDVLMQQMGVERNLAIRALRQSEGDLIDAMMALGNK